MDELDGNESQPAMADWIADALRLAIEEMDGEYDGRFSVQVEHGFQSFITFRHPNGAQFQVTPVRSAWPEDGTSTQWDDDEEEGESER